MACALIRYTLANDGEITLFLLKSFKEFSILIMIRPTLVVLIVVLLLASTDGRRHQWFGGRSTVIVGNQQRPRGSRFLPRRLRVMRGGQDEKDDPNATSSVMTNDTAEEVYPKKEESAEEETVVLVEAEEVVVEVDNDGEDMEELHVDSEAEEDYYFSDSDVENELEQELLKDLAVSEEENVEEKQEVYDTTEAVVETVVDLTKRTSILALKASKITAIWLKQWSWDLYRACLRAIEAGRLELEEGGDDSWLISELSDDDESSSRFQKYKKKLVRLFLRCFKTAKSMTIAFWSMDDDYDDLLFDENLAQKEQPSVSFFSKVKLHKDSEEKEEYLPREAIVEGSSVYRVDMRCVGGDGSIVTIKRAKQMPPSAVTVSFNDSLRRRKILVNVVVAVASIALWEQVGGQALLAKAVQMVQQRMQRIGNRKTK
eukprot:scaffold24012_cov186-Cylindrotheca_fusiformis.AAC.3